MPKQNTKPADYPQAVIQQIALLSQNIVVARKRRKETQAQWAKRLGVSQPTMARIERGDPSVAMASYVMCMWLINPGASLADLVAPQLDTIALEREIARVRPRARMQGATGESPKGPASSAAKRSLNSDDGSMAVATATPARSAAGSAQTAAGLAALMAKAHGHSR
jgi:DNA-binding XRE family transcriptional regulator